MKSFIFKASGILLMIFMAGGTVFAANTAVVGATVTVQNISLTVTANSTISYGTLAIGATKGTNASDLNTTPIVQNNGNVTEDFAIKGQDATGSTQTWTLATTAGSAQYYHKFCTATCNTPPTNYTALTTNNQTLATSKATSATQSFDLYLGTPTSGVTDYTSHAVDVTLTATAS